MAITPASAKYFLAFYRKIAEFMNRLYRRIAKCQVGAALCSLVPALRRAAIMNMQAKVRQRNEQAYYSIDYRRIVLTKRQEIRYTVLTRFAILEERQI